MLFGRDGLLNRTGNYCGPLNAAGNPHGQGKVDSYLQKTSYRGDWCDGKITGKGFLRYKAHGKWLSLAGEFLNGYPYGHGILWHHNFEDVEYNFVLECNFFKGKTIGGEGLILVRSKEQELVRNWSNGSYELWRARIPSILLSSFRFMCSEPVFSEWKGFKLLEWFGTVRPLRDSSLISNMAKSSFGDMEKLIWTTHVLLPNGTDVLLRFRGLTEVSSSS